MSVLSEIITVNITRETAGLTQAGFGTALIFGDSDKFAKVDGVVLTFDAALITGNQINWTLNGVEQTPVPFNADNDTTMADLDTALTAAAAIASATPSDVGAVGYDNTMTIVGAADPARVVLTNLSVSGGASQAGITQVYTPHTRVETYTDPDDMLVAGGGVFAATDLEYLAAVSLMAQDPGPTQFKVGQERSGDASKTDALAAIAVQDDDWYALICTSRTQADQEEVALCISTKRKLYLTSDGDAAILTTGTSDIAGTMAAASYDRAGVLYHEDSDATTNDRFPEAAWFGRCLPKVAGSVNWAYKQLTSVPVSSLTATQRTNALAKNANIYYEIAGNGVTREGTMASGEFIDTMRGADHLQALMEEGIFLQYLNQDKIPFDDVGIAIHVAEIRKAIEQKIKDGYLTRNTDPDLWDGAPYYISAPLAKDVSAANKAARSLTNVTFKALIAGAINKVTVNGTVTV